MTILRIRRRKGESEDEDEDDDLQNFNFSSKLFGQNNILAQKQKWIFTN